MAVSAALLTTSLLFVGAVGSPVAAATLVVDDDNVECSGATFNTIQDAVNAASAGDTIQVCAGLYPEPAAGPLTINKTLTLLGAWAGVDARTRVPTGESIITDPNGTSVSASGVVIDGFTVQASSSSAFTGYGIWLNPGISGTEIVNNIIQDNIAGIGLANAGAAEAVIQFNLFRNNTLPGGATGSGIYTDEFVGGPIVRDVLIDSNAFIDNSGFGAAINISNTAFTGGGGVYDLTVSANQFTANSRAFVLFNTHDSTFVDNTVTGSTFAASADVRIFDNNTNLFFSSNDLSAGLGHAVRISGALPSSDLVFDGNNIEVYGLTGMTVDPGSHTGTVDAECNYWNSATGPTALTNPGGTGEEVVGDVDFDPWLTSHDGACVAVNEPGNKDDCKDDGWMTRTRADGSTFKNQGDCIQYRNSGK